MSSSPSSAALHATVTPPHAMGAAPESAKERRHHQKGGKGFENPWESFKMMSSPAIVKQLLERRFLGQGKIPDTTPPTVPVRKPSFSTSRQQTRLRSTWLGHACFYVEFPGGLHVLFDPVFTSHCSPISWLGPKRYTDMPCQIEDIPIIDLVVISHNHYDHLSYPTIKKIHEQHPNAHFFAPLGNKKWFTDSGVDKMTELDWWESRDVLLSSSSAADSGSSVGVAEPKLPTDSPSIKARIGCLPCQHMSARGPFDRAHSLWASWSIESGDKKLWFSGDTGYRSVPRGLPEDADYEDPALGIPHCPAFKEIGEFRGPFDLGLIAIGAYEPRYLFSPVHADPFDSVNIFVDTRCRQALGMHWGTWVLTEEDVLEPPRLLKKALAKKMIPEEGVFDVCDIGESREFSGPSTTSL